MKILSLACYCFPEEAASAYLSQNRNQAMADAGIETLVYTPTPTRGVSVELRNKYKRIKKEERFNGMMKIHRFSMYAEGKNPVMRAFRYLLIDVYEFFAGAFSKNARTCDVMFIASTPPIQGAMAAMVKKFNRIPLVYNLQDIFPDSLAGTGLAKKGGLIWKIGRAKIQLQNATTSAKV